VEKWASNYTDVDYVNFSMLFKILLWFLPIWLNSLPL